MSKTVEKNDCLGFYTKLKIFMLMSAALGTAVYAALTYELVPVLRLPPVIFVLVTASPFIVFVIKAVKDGQLSFPLQYLRIIILLFCSLFFLSVWLVLELLWRPNMECLGRLGAGALNGKKVIVHGICTPFMHEYEEWIEFYPAHAGWIGGREGGSRVASLGPSALGIERELRSDGRLGSHPFPSRPTRVELDGSSFVTVYFADGTMQKVQPNFD